MRLIDADALLDAISAHLERIEQEIDDAYNPMIEYAPVRNGRWVETSEESWLVKCNLCGVLVDDGPSAKRWNYCPNCGARMDGDDGDC